MPGQLKLSHRLVSALILLLLPATSYAGLYPNDHTGLYVGFGVGYGSASFDLPNDEIVSRDFNDEGSIAGHFFVGGALNQVFLFGVETNGWVKEVDGADWTLVSGAATMTVYPIEYLFLRAGPTVGNIEVSDDSVDSPFGPSRLVSRSDSGYGFTLAAGAELRLKKNFAIVPSVRYVWLDIEDVTVNFVSGVVSVGWFW